MTEKFPSEGPDDEDDAAGVHDRDGAEPDSSAFDDLDDATARTRSAVASRFPERT